MPQPAPTLIVGFAAEAAVARLSGWPVAIGGGTTEGAARAAETAIAAGAPGLISFGLAGGLDPALAAGTLLMPAAVLADGRIWAADAGLIARPGGGTGHLCLGLDRVAATVAEKRQLHQQTKAACVDMESGAIAAVATGHGIPFAVLRAICDPADRDLPPAALVALDPAGRIALGPLFRSLVRHPGQIGGLLRLARDAAAARQALRAAARRLAAKADATGHL